MGNDESIPITTNFSISQHRPLESGLWQESSNKRTRTSLYIHTSHTVIKSATLISPPPTQSLFLTCPRCKSSIFDGGLHKAVSCPCSLLIKRMASGRVMQVPQLSPNFLCNFEFQSSTPKYSFIPELITLNLGFFQSDDSSLIHNNVPNFSLIFDQCLSPFFSQSLRCLGVGDFFIASGSKFKVLGAFPNYGVVTENTVISCSELLSQRTIERIHILPIVPFYFTEDVFSQNIQPYFRKIPRHVSAGEYLYIDGKSFIVTACQPENGVVSSESHFYFTGEPLHPIEHLSVSPYIEDLTYHYNTLNQTALIEEILNKYIMPYFQGFKRLITLGQDLIIDGITFKVIECWPHKGIVIDSTNISYDGSLCQRENGFYSQNTVLIRRGNVMEDPLFVLSQQMYQMQQIMNEDPTGAQEGVPRNIISQFPVEHLDRDIDPNEDLRCMICLCHYQRGEGIKTLTCSKIYLVHNFHAPCIDEWLRRSVVCPLCKRSVLSN